MGADAGSIHLGEDATETRVKSLDLSATRVIAFATHGLLAGDLKGVAEPALVLTPPEQGTERDDGLLTASEGDLKCVQHRGTGRHTGGEGSIGSCQGVPLCRRTGSVGLALAGGLCCGDGNHHTLVLGDGWYCGDRPR